MKKILLLLVIVFISACSTLNMQDPAHKLAVQYATGKFIERTPVFGRVGAARKVIAYAESAKQLFDFERKSLVDIEAELLRRLATERLSISDRALATALIQSVADNIEQKTNIGVIDDEKKVTVNEILNAIIVAANWYNI